MSLDTGSATRSASARPSRQALHAAKMKAAEVATAKAAAEKSGAQGVLGTVGDAVGNVLGSTVSFSEQAYDSLKSGAGAVADEVGSGLNATYRAVKSGVSSAMSSPVVQQAIAVPVAIVSNVGNAAESVLGEAAGLASDAASVATMGLVGGSKLIALLA